MVRSWPLVPIRPPSSQTCLVGPGASGLCGLLGLGGCPWNLWGPCSWFWPCSLFTRYLKDFRHFFYFFLFQTFPHSVQKFVRAFWEFPVTTTVPLELCKPRALPSKQRLSAHAGTRPRVRMAALVSIPKGLWTRICVSSDLCCPRVWLSCYPMVI